MKLILSSCDFLNPNSRQAIIENLDKDLADHRVLFIPNEKATPADISSGKYLWRLSANGFTNPDNCCIFDEANADAFRGLDIDLIYVGGGNTFATLAKLRKCGFDKEIAAYVNNGVTYIGGS
ncbi:MAG: Type 1 glutamine amidotransferase-like domain-containing protein, partial [Lentisphaeria bacterium]|nr:Type 1 glutamine amidotransferase-like domain-containing protein [Lentisphaeria bacterium]